MDRSLKTHILTENSATYKILNFYYFCNIYAHFKISWHIIAHVIFYKN